MIASWFALEWPNEFWRDPASVEAAWLWHDCGAIDAAIEGRGVEGHAIGKRLSACQWVRIAPCDIRQASITVH